MQYKYIQILRSRAWPYIARTNDLVTEHDFGTEFDFWVITFQLFIIVWLRITDEGLVPEMRIWSIRLIKSD